MQRNNLDNIADRTEKNIKENSTKEIFITLARGNKPAKPVMFGKPVRIYDSQEELKIDEEGMPYIGMSLRELMEQKSKQSDAIQTTETIHTCKKNPEANQQPTQPYSPPDHLRPSPELIALSEQSKVSALIYDEDDDVYYLPRLK